MIQLVSLAPTVLEALERVIRDVVAPRAVEVDKHALFPREALDALGKAGLLGLISAKEVGGLGEGPRAAAGVVSRLAQECGSTAMVVCMHYAGTAVIEQHGPRELRQKIAKGEHLTTLAFSEAGSRSHFWAPTSTAQQTGDMIRIDAKKSWITSAAQADSYVWSSQPVAAEGASTLWLMEAKAGGLNVVAPFDGLGLRGNASSAVTAERVHVQANARLGPDGGGFDIMMGTVLPIFQLMTAAFAVGTMEAATAKAAAHVAGTSLEHLSTALSDLPTVRAYVARMRIKTDMSAALLGEALAAVEAGREDTMLRVLESKAAAGETALEVTDLAMRVCGGAAFRKEVGVERHFRDARAGSVMAPTTDVLYDFIGKAVTGLPLF